VTSLLTDPIVLICAAIIILGVFGFLWGVSRFRKIAKLSSEDIPADDVFPIAATPLESDLRPSPVRAPVTPPVTSSTPAVSREVADRLESMTQRLSEMQTVLMKQSGGGGASAAGGVGQGFSPETIDKLLKIVGNVIQQVDILQKSLTPPPK
jgi:hypothetical protein